MAYIEPLTSHQGGSWQESGKLKCPREVPSKRTITEEQKNLELLLIS